MNEKAVAPIFKAVTFREAVRVWLRIGLLSFGGPAGQIALMHRELVEQRRWISETRFLHALNYCMLLPGPEAQQLAIYIGWLMHRTWGGIVAGVLFVLPGALTVLLLSILYMHFQQQPLVASLFFGLKAAVLAIVVEAVLRIGRRALKSRFLIAMAAAAFVAIFAFDVPFPIIVLGAGLVGAVAYRISPSLVPQAHRAKIELDSADSVIDHLFATGQLNHARPSAARLLRVLLLWSMLWITPIALLAAWQGVHSVFVQQGLFFSQAAVVTFGGAYSVLSYVAQRAVEDFSWLHPGEMLDGLALAETTPGPLILVLQFVAYVGAYRASTDLSPLAAGILGAGVCLWVTFIPCFLWIFLGAPYIEALRNLRILNAAMSCITAAVVGVILNLSVWFALHTLFTEVRSLRYGWFNLSVPNWSTLNVAAFVLTVAALVAMLRLKISMPATLLGCALLGWLWLLY
jgi:chromate transporter